MKKLNLMTIVIQVLKKRMEYLIMISSHGSAPLATSAASGSNSRDDRYDPKRKRVREETRGCSVEKELRRLKTDRLKSVALFMDSIEQSMMAYLWDWSNMMRNHFKKIRGKRDIGGKRNHFTNIDCKARHRDATASASRISYFRRRKTFTDVNRVSVKLTNASAKGYTSRMKFYSIPLLRIAFNATSLLRPGFLIITSARCYLDPLLSE
ncbi:hypothetical protein PanWU01x14_281980 [Parasponia andersonii]|uniref:Uncharacterized protein n=1 Tax=Parasponia andersonii TaxID=3476 RepID=A0A2P5B0V4_PARAD|nr:hypothetical protein PanWU01x14_281980 [Parasponia andersonii]